MPVPDEAPLHRPELLPLLGLAVVAAAAWWWSVEPPPAQAWLAMLTEAAPLGILTVATTLLLAGGAVDLALGGLAVAAAMLASRLPGLAGLAPSIGALCGLAAATLLAALDGVVVTLTRRPAWLVTGAMLLGYAGLSALLAGLPAVAAALPVRWETLAWQSPALAVGLGGGAVLTVPPVPLALWCWVAALIAVPLLLHGTVGGSRALALGASPAAAQDLGVSLLGARAWLFATAGGLAGLSGLLDPAAAGPIQPLPELSGATEALAAAIIGGGLGNRRRHAFLGGALAVLLMMLVGRGLAMAGLPPALALLVLAMILLLALVGGTRARRAAETV
jgi:ribose transport system permease protein